MDEGPDVRDSEKHDMAVRSASTPSSVSLAQSDTRRSARRSAPYKRTRPPARVGASLPRVPLLPRCHSISLTCVHLSSSRFSPPLSLSGYSWPRISTLQLSFVLYGTEERATTQALSTGHAALASRHPCTVARTSSSPGSSGNIGGYLRVRTSAHAHPRARALAKNARSRCAYCGRWCV